MYCELTKCNATELNVQRMNFLYSKLKLCIDNNKCTANQLNTLLIK